ncbi:MAG: GIY-YIG nuclease family protein [Eubacteriaceae bacterium]|jgi:putative endonuclease|nr:GIY-YIG nuclease family protein [Eubacteriaceae bacterium]
MSGHFVYILKCGDGSYYTGWTTDVEHRVAAHAAGRGAKYTRGRGPVELVHVEEFATKSEALSREIAIKKLSRSQKEALINGDQ